MKSAKPVRQLHPLHHRPGLTTVSHSHTRIDFGFFSIVFAATAVMSSWPSSFCAQFESTAYAVAATLGAPINTMAQVIKMRPYVATLSLLIVAVLALAVWVTVPLPASIGTAQGYSIATGQQHVRHLPTIMISVE